MGISDRIWGAVVAFGIATNITACIMALYIQKYELMINYFTNILFLIIIAITYIKMKINKWVALGFTLVVMEKVLRQVMNSTHMITMVSVGVYLSLSIAYT